MNAGSDAASPEIDAIGRRQRPLVRADAPDDLRARDRESAAGRQRGIERADDAVVEDHAASLTSSPRVTLSVV